VSGGIRFGGLCWFNRSSRPRGPGPTSTAPHQFTIYHILFPRDQLNHHHHLRLASYWQPHLHLLLAYGEKQVSEDTTVRPSADVPASWNTHLSDEIGKPGWAGQSRSEGLRTDLRFEVCGDDDVEHMHICINIETNGSFCMDAGSHLHQTENNCEEAEAVE
jgi:hypothetical protein